MEMKNFNSLIETNIEQLDDFSKWLKEYKKETYELIQEGIKSGEIAIIKGQGFDLEYEAGHECDCEFCEKESEDKVEFFTTMKELKERTEYLIKNDYSLIPDDFKISEGSYFIKAVKQEKGELWQK